MRSKNEDRLNGIFEYMGDVARDESRVASISEIADRFGMKKANAYQYVLELKERGLVESLGKIGYAVIDKREKERFNGVSVVGEVACGQPIFDEENIEEIITLPERFTGKGEFFFLRAKGDSMINAGINHGDLVLIRKQSTAEQGQIIVVLCEDSEATLKRFYKEKGKAILHPENDSMEDIIVFDCRIQGVAIKVIKDL
ncbi:MAG: transcriptional repressor LexA [Bacillota bacterium]